MMTQHTFAKGPTFVGELASIEGGDVIVEAANAIAAAEAAKAAAAKKKDKANESGGGGGGKSDSKKDGGGSGDGKGSGTNSAAVAALAQASVDLGVDVAAVNPILTQMQSTAQLYLEAATRAFPAVALQLSTQALSTKERAQKLDQHTAAVTQCNEQFALEHLMTQRVHLANETQRLRKRRFVLLEETAAQAKHFETLIQEQRTNSATELAELQRTVDKYRLDANQAERWRVKRHREKEKSDETARQMEESKAKFEVDTTKLRAQNDDARRRLRDALTRNLRKVRDAMSSTTTDGAVPPMVNHNNSSTTNDAHSNNNTATAAGGGGSAAALNDRLARAVTMYDREARTVASSLAALQVSNAAALQSTTKQREANETLVAKNAAHRRAITMLRSQIAALKATETQLTHQSLNDQRQQRHATREAVAAQNHLLAVLRDELKEARRLREEAKADRAEVTERLRRLQRDRERAIVFFDDTHVKAMEDVTKTMMMAVVAQQSQADEGLAAPTAAAEGGSDWHSTGAAWSSRIYTQPQPHRSGEGGAGGVRLPSANDETKKTLTTHSFPTSSSKQQQQCSALLGLSTPTDVAVFLRTLLHDRSGAEAHHP